MFLPKAPTVTSRTIAWMELMRTCGFKPENPERQQAVKNWEAVKNQKDEYDC